MNNLKYLSLLILSVFLSSCSRGILVDGNLEQVYEEAKLAFPASSTYFLPNLNAAKLLLFEVSLFSANRLGALERLTISSLDLDNMVFEGIREKEGYRVEVSFDDTCKDMIETWLSMRKDDYDHLECDALFIHKYNDEWKPWTKNMIYERMKKFGEIIGLEDFHTHCMRKTAINKIYEDTGDLNLAAQWANHKSSAVTQASYIKPVSKSAVSLVYSLPCSSHTFTCQEYFVIADKD